MGDIFGVAQISNIFFGVLERREPGILFISFSIVSLFKLAIITPFSILC